MRKLKVLTAFHRQPWLTVFLGLCLGAGISSQACARSIDELEQALTASIGMHSCWLDYGDWKLHYLRSQPCANPKSQRNLNSTVLLVHGMGSSSAIAWSSSAPLLISEGVDVVALDLPGFGRSIMPDRVIHSDFTEILLELCSALEYFISTLPLSQPFVVAHSFGGYVTGYCVSTKPHLVSGLLLVDTAGVLPINGKFSHMWATVFNLGLPQTVVRPMGPFGQTLVNTLLDADTMVQGRKHLFDTVSKYWHKLHTSPDLHSHIIAPKFFNYSWTRTVGRLALLPYLLNLTVPLALAYGENDFMTPPQQGQLVAYVTHTSVYIISEAPHCPYHIRGGRDFADVVLHARAHSAVPGPHSQRLANHLHGQDVIRWSKYTGSWSVADSHRNEKALYRDVLNAFLTFSGTDGKSLLVGAELALGRSFDARSEEVYEIDFDDLAIVQELASSREEPDFQTRSTLGKVYSLTGEMFSSSIGAVWRLLISRFPSQKMHAVAAAKALYGAMKSSVKRHSLPVTGNATADCTLQAHILNHRNLNEPGERHDEHDCVEPYCIDIPALCLPSRIKEAVVEVIGSTSTVVLVSYEWNEALAN